MNNQLIGTPVIDLTIGRYPDTFPSNVKAHSHRAKTKIFFDACNLFFDLFIS